MNAVETLAAVVHVLGHGAQKSFALAAALRGLTRRRQRHSRQRITMALLPVPAALAITAAALLAPHRVASDVVFVVIVFAAVYIRRFGARGRALGMVAFMAYFFTLYLRASIS
jgi:hypothetical protein